MERKKIKREELYELIWREPVMKVAAAYGISGNGLSKICRKLDIPVPSRGYWQRLAAGQAPEKRPLPPLADGTPAEYTLAPPPMRAPPIERAPEALAAVEAEKGRGPIVVPDVIEELHPLVRRSVARLRKRKERETVWADEACIDINVSTAMLDRACRVMHAVIVELAARGMTVEITKPHGPRGGDTAYSRTLVTVLGEKLGIALAEKLVYTREKSEPTAAEKRRLDRMSIRERAAATAPTNWWESRPEGKLRLQIRGPDGKVRESWVDRDNRLVETCLNDFVRQLYYVADDLRRSREQHARWERERAESERRACEQAERQRRHDALVKDARQRMDDLAFARDLRGFATEVESTLASREGGIAERSAEARWLAWARSLADRVEQHVLTTVADAWAPKSMW